MNILITGGASGLGKFITLDLLQNKDNTIIFTYAKSKDDAIEITSKYENSIALKCDFSSTEEVDSLCEKIKEFPLDIFIHNAYHGDFISKHFSKTKIDDFRASFDLNILPTIQIAQAVIEIFKKKKSGKIITILTEALINKSPIGTSVYTANKAYLKQLSKTWATEYIKFNITSNCVSPSFMQTNMTKDFDERILEKMIMEHPLKELLKPEDVLNTIQYLISASNHLNGVDIVLNAGQNFK